MSKLPNMKISAAESDFERRRLSRIFQIAKGYNETVFKGISERDMLFYDSYYLGDHMALQQGKNEAKPVDPNLAHNKYNFLSRYCSCGDRNRQKSKSN